MEFGATDSFPSVDFYKVLHFLNVELEQHKLTNSNQDIAPIFFFWGGIYIYTYITDESWIPLQNTKNTPLLPFSPAACASASAFSFCKATVELCKWSRWSFNLCWQAWIFTYLKWRNPESSPSCMDTAKGKRENSTTNIAILGWVGPPSNFNGFGTLLGWRLYQGGLDEARLTVGTVVSYP